MSSGFENNRGMLREEFAGRLAAGHPPAVGGRTGAIVIEERSPAHFMAAFASAAGSGELVFLGDPQWGDEQRARFGCIMDAATWPAGAAGDRKRGWLMIASGGTGGGLKFARHDQDTVSAAVGGFCAHFGIQRVNAIGVLPLHHVSGFMAWMRCALTGGVYLPCEWKALEQGERPEMRDGDWVISLVPTQLQRLLGSATTVAWLRRFRVIFLGGGPAWPSLLAEAAAARLPISISYGMTETAAMIAASRPAEFLAGQRDRVTVLPHGRITIADGAVVRVGGGSLFRGYFPGWRDTTEFETDDVGTFDPNGRLTILGRRDAMIISGGRKVNPIEVESALRASGEFGDVAVIGVPDAEWGEVVVACYPVGDRAADLARATAMLAAYQRPKRFIAIADWPRNALGKLNRAALRARVMAAPDSQFLM